MQTNILTTETSSIFFYNAITHNNYFVKWLHIVPEPSGGLIMSSSPKRLKVYFYVNKSMLNSNIKLLKKSAGI